MRTPPMSDKELDGWFRRGAEAYPDIPELPLGAWEHLEQQLDAAAQQPVVRRQVTRQVMRLFVLELLLVALCLLWWQGSRPGSVVNNPLIDNAPAASQTPRPATGPAAASRPKASKPKSAATLSQQATAVAQLGDTTPTLTPTAPAADGAPQATVPQTTTENTLPATLAGQQRYRPVLTPTPKPTKPGRIVAAERRFAPPASNVITITAAPVAIRSRMPERGTETTIDPREAAASAGTAATLEQQPPTVESWLAPILLTAAPDSGNALPARLPVAATPNLNPLPLPADSGQTKPPRERPAYRLLLGVVGAPELTGVRASELTRPGTTLGAVAEYRISTKLRLRSGLLYSKKLYQARGSDYHPPAGYWTQRIPVDRITADCRILEIPLDLRYELLQRPTYSLFASAGFSSLLMRNEEYIYDFTQNGQPMQRTWSLARGSNHPLSLLSLSVGYERPLGARWVAQAEPFLKLPLGGVGFGNVRLRGAGVSFGLRYGLLPSRPAVRLP